MELENENVDFNFKTPEEYIGKLDELNGGVGLLLDEFKKIYVISRMHPDNEEIQQRYQNMIASINQIQSKLFSTSNDVQVNINDLNKKLVGVDILIRREREINKELKRKLGIVEHKNNSATEMISDYKEVYDIKYLRNWGLFLTTIIGLVTIGTVYKKQGV